MHRSAPVCVPIQYSTSQSVTSPTQTDLQDFLNMNAPPAPNAQVSPCIHFILYLTVWGVEPVVTHKTSWLESTGAVRVQVLYSIRQSVTTLVLESI